MAEMDNTIMIQGLFGEKAANDLIDMIKELKGSGSTEILVDFSGCGEVLAEGVMTISDEIDDLLSINGNFTIKFDHLNESDSRIFLLFGFPVNARQFTLPVENDTGESKGITTVCEKCGSEIQTDGPGLFRCPVCHCHFHLDGRGRSVFYDSIEGQNGVSI